MQVVKKIMSNYSNNYDRFPPNITNNTTLKISKDKGKIFLYLSLSALIIYAFFYFITFIETLLEGILTLGGIIGGAFAFSKIMGGLKSAISLRGAFKK